MDQDTLRINKSIKLFPIFSSLSGDLIFFIPIDTLFLTLVKGLSASQITAITMISLLVCIISQNMILSIAKKIGNKNSIRLGSFLLLISAIILTFAKAFPLLLLYRCICEISFMFLSMSVILLKNNLISINKHEDYYKIRNRSKIMYSLATLITAFLSGYLFNLNNYLPMYISIVINFLIFIASFTFYEAKVNGENDNKNEEVSKKKNVLNKKIVSVIFWIVLSNAIFYSIIKLGQSNGKLFMQYDFHEVLSVEMVTYYITIIVFFSRIARLVGNVIFGKLYLKIKDNMSIVLTVLLTIAFILLIVGHFLQVEFIYKALIMSFGFFLILATRDSFQVYIEDAALNITDRDEQQKIMIDIDVCRKLVSLILSAVFTLVLVRYELIVIMFLLLIFAIIEIFVNIKMCRQLKGILVK